MKSLKKNALKKNNTKIEGQRQAEEIVKGRQRVRERERRMRKRDGHSERKRNRRLRRQEGSSGDW